MKTTCLCAMFLLMFSVPSLPADEPLDIAGDYQQIVADYQRIVAATNNATAKAAAGRLTRNAYRHLIEKAKAVEEPNADDLHALGSCHEAIGESDKAKELYAKSLETKPTARTLLSLARVNIEDDLKAADAHFANAVKADPAHPDLNRFRLSLAVAHQRQRNWGGSIPYLEHLVAYAGTLADRTPANSKLKVTQGRIQKQLDRMRRFVGMQGQAAPTLKVTKWAQGEAAKIDDFKGKVVLVDFCAMWAKPSRDRMELLKKLLNKYADKGLEIVGLTLPYKHKYNAENDKVTLTQDLSIDDEAVGLAAFAKKHEIPWRLAVIAQENVDEFGVETLPHTVAIDKAGNVYAIVLGGDRSEEALSATVEALLN